MWLKPLFLAYDETDDRIALAVALDIVADWISAHSTAASNLSEFAWYDMAVSHRATAIAYALRVGLSEGMIDAERATLLLQACNAMAPS
jgi:hypothetical protein